MDVDRYITDEAVMAFMDARCEESSEYKFWAEVGLRAALPHIIPAVRADAYRDTAEGVAHISTRAVVAEDAIQRVRDLHDGYLDNACRECLDQWPCPTIRALDGV